MPTLAGAVRNLYITLSSAVIEGFGTAIAAINNLLDFSDEDNSMYLVIF